MYEKACSLNQGEGCDNLGRSYYWGKGTKYDYTIARQLFEKACDLGVQSGCDNYRNLTR